MNRLIHNTAKTTKLALFLTLIPIYAYSLDVTNPIPFTGGVDHYNTPTEVSETRAVDIRNFVPDVSGSASVRDGSKFFIDQAISTNPINSTYWATVNMGTYTKKALIVTTWDRIYVSTLGSSNVWKCLKSDLMTHNQHFSFANSNGKIVMTGDALTDDIFQYDLLTDAFSILISVDASTSVLKMRAKYVLAPNGYLVLGNVAYVDDLTGDTTNYPSRIHYSLFNQISSFTWSRYINIRTDDGEELTGMTEKGGTTGNIMCIYKPSSISNIVYRVLNLDEFGGDIVVDTVVNGFGCISPLALVNAGSYDIVPTRDGIIFFDGGRKSRLNLIDEVKPISTFIKQDYEKTLKYSTYDKSVGFYYPRKQWYLFSFCDPTYSPTEKANRVFVFDIKTGEWWIMDNWLAGSFTSKTGQGDDGTPIYGSSVDGFVHEFDIKSTVDDSRKEISIDSCESVTKWDTKYSQDKLTVVEGTSSLKIQNNFLNSFSTSMTRIDLINFGEFYDGYPVSRDTDYLTFKLKLSSVSNLTSLRIDLQYEVTETSFTSYFSSVTLSSGSIVTFLTENSEHTTNFGEIKIKLSSFTIPSFWYTVTSNDDYQIVPFANCLTVYGIRFVVNGISTCTINIDDIRVVQGNNAPINAWFLTKNFNLGNVKNKDFRQIVLSSEQDATASFYIDVLNDYGYYSNKIDREGRIPKEIYVCGYKGTDGISKLKSENFELIDSTSLQNSNVIDYMNGIATSDYLIMFDKVLNRLLLLDRDNLSVIISSYGSLGTGATNFDTVNQISYIEKENLKYLFVTDSMNHRIGKFLIDNDEIKLVQFFGEIGNGTTNFLVPTGISADLTNLWVLDDGNFRIVKYSLDFDYISEKRIDSNTIGEGVLQNDGENLFIAYNKATEETYYQDVVLEKRTKGSMELLQRKSLRPENITTQSTYTLSGDFCLLGRYIFIGFTKDLAQTGTYYLQKLLKDDFDISGEYSTNETQFSVIGDATPYIPISKSDKIDLRSKSGSVYCQLKFYTDNKTDNKITLKNYSFAVNQSEYSEGR